MNKTTTYGIGEVSIVFTEGNDTAVFVAGKKKYPVYSSDLLEFCREFIRTQGVGGEVVEPIKERRKQVLADFDDRKAVSASPLKTITMDEWNKIERAPTPIPGVSFSGAVNMPAPTTPSFKK